MSEIFFFFSVCDPSVPREALRLGNYLLVNKDYSPSESLMTFSEVSNDDINVFRRFYVLPSEAFLSEIALRQSTKRTGEKFLYITDRIGAAAIDLILYEKPSEGEVCVGSLGFQARTYPSETEPLAPRPKEFSEAFRSLSSYIRRSAERISNSNTPKTVYVFPNAMKLIRQDISRSPWSSIEIKQFRDNSGNPDHL